MSRIRKPLQITLSLIMVFSITLSATQPENVYAQGKDGIKLQRNSETGKVNFITSESGRPLIASQALGLNPGSRPADPAMALAQRYAPEFGIRNPATELYVFNTDYVNNGRLTVRYQQKYQGIPVIGGELIVNTNENGDLYSVNGEISPDLSLQTQPTIDSEHARQFALQGMAKWYQFSPDDFVISQPELWIFDESLLHPSMRPAELVWRMDVTSKDAGNPIRELVLINAKTGNPSLHFNQIDTAWKNDRTELSVHSLTSEPFNNSTYLKDTPFNAEASAQMGVPFLVEPVQLYDISSNRSSEDSMSLQSGGSLYVATTGNDSSDCLSTLFPCLTINGAIGKAINGDTIYVAEGIYTGSGLQVVLISGKQIAISGGWDGSFNAQQSISIIDGQGVRRGITANSSANVVIDHFVVQNGYSGMGGGVYNNSSTMALNTSVITNNVSITMGGGVYNYGTLTINNTAIIGNTTGDPCCSGGGGGGGIANNSGTLTLNNSTVSGNKIVGGYPGSGIVVWGTAFIYNSTVSDNTGGYGEGIFVIGTVALNSSTISNNQTYGIRNETGSITLQNTIVSGNGSDGDCYDNSSYSGDIVSQGYNLIGNKTGCGIILGTGDLINVNARLGELVGFPGYLPLMSNSPAINTGSPSTPGSSGTACLSVDQRGISRPVGGRCDIGAYEYTVSGAATNLSIVSGNAQRTGPNLAFTYPLKVAILDNQGSPVANVNVTFTAPSSGASGVFTNTGTRTTSISTNSNGVAATSIFTANSYLGAYNVSASINGTLFVNFNLQNKAWFVSPLGSDANLCSMPEAPCATIDSAISKMLSGDTIQVAIGVYTSLASVGITLNKDVNLSGGWNDSFTVQNGLSTIDGQGVRRGITTGSNVNVIMSRFKVQNGVGGGIYNYLSTIVLNDSIITDNKDSGIINYSRYGLLTINNTVIRHNVAGDTCCVGGGGGGGIDNSSGTIVLNNSLVSENSLLGGFSGSGINSDIGTVILNNTTVSGNTGGDGSGIYIFTATVILNNSTISFNQGLGYNNYAGHVTIQNTIVAGNGTGSDCRNYMGGTTSKGYNLIGNGSYCSFTAITGDIVGDISNPIDPRLSPLRDNGGLTLTHALLGGSPAINAGNSATCLSVDQRGIGRPQGTLCDIGAIEYQPGNIPESISVLQGSSQVVGLNAVVQQNLAAVVTDVSGAGVPGVTVTFTAPLTGASGVFSNTGSNVTTSITGYDGVATASVYTSNSTPGSYAIQATGSGVVGVTNFELVNSRKINTYTANHTKLLPGTLLCTETTLNCTNGNNPHADAVHRYTIGIYNLYASQFNRDSIDNNGMTIISTVQYGSSFDNAYWSGTQMVYGDAYGFANSDDIVAHELTHGVTQYESNLFYFYQSGAINESLSDLFGEYYDQTNRLGTDTLATKWLLGEDTTGLGAVRSMSNPPVYGDPDKISSPNYFKGSGDNGGVHYNSGVNNKAVFLMVDGGIFNGKTVTGIGWDKTAAIYYEANTNLLSSGSDYSDLYFALYQACNNLIGQKDINSFDCQQVRNATNAVEMNGQPSVNFNVDTSLCPGDLSVDQAFVSFSDNFENSLVNWNISNSWKLDSFYASSPVHMMWGDDTVESSESILTMKNGIYIPPGTMSFIHFKHAFAFEYDISAYYDGGVFEYSNNGGASWLDAGELYSDGANYAGAILNDPLSSNVLRGRLGFVGDSHGYVSSRYDLSSLAGQTVKFRWRFATDQFYSYLGWVLDDIQVYDCAVTYPNLLSPDKGILVNDLTPTLKWSYIMPSFDHYQLQLDTDDTFTSPIYDVNVTVPEYTISSNLSMNAGYYWRVRAFNTNGLSRGWSAVGMFRIPPGDTSAILPANAAYFLDLRPTFDWTDVSGVGYYKIQVSKNSDFTQIVAEENSLPSTITLSKDLPPAQKLYWRVRAEGANGPSKWTETRWFTTPNPPGVPVLKSPANNITTTDNLPVFRWYPVGVPRNTIFDHYQIQVSADSVFTSPVIDVAVAGSVNPTYTPGASLVSGSIYHWRVRAVNSNNELSSWSEVRLFTTPGNGIISNRPGTFNLDTLLPVPVISTSLSGGVADTARPTLEWSDAPGATGYIVQVSTDQVFASSNIVSATTVNSEYMFMKELPAGKVIYWRVLTIKGNNFSNWSDIGSFKTP